MSEFWNKGIKLVSGCTKVSEGCVNCWAEKKHEGRFHTNPCYEGLTTGGKFNGKVRFNLHLLEKAAKRKEPTVYAIWNDLYHDGIAKISRVAAMTIMQAAPHHIWLIVTKRPEVFVEGFLDTVPDNVWHLITCENQKRLNERMPHILRIPGKRGLLIEPMLEAVDLNNVSITQSFSDEFFPAFKPMGGLKSMDIMTLPAEYGIHQVILGPENGGDKRPFDPAWADSVKAQCEAAGVPFYRKDTEEGVLAWRQ